MLVHTFIATVKTTVTACCTVDATFEAYAYPQSTTRLALAISQCYHSTQQL